VKVLILAAFSVGAVALGVEVDAGFGFIVVGDIRFVSNFLIEVGKGALDIVRGTPWLKGQYPFYNRYLHFLDRANIYLGLIF
jgi:hypothetical protein